MVYRQNRWLRLISRLVQGQWGVEAKTRLL
jgi:hypothetical protein